MTDPEPALVAVVHVATHQMTWDSDYSVTVAIVVPEGTRTACLYIVDPEDVRMFVAVCNAHAETVVSSGELIPYAWLLRLAEQSVNAPALEYVWQ
jgi:hypothetical protein